jgi:hypothetical protein
MSCVGQGVTDTCAEDCGTITLFIDCRSLNIVL